MDKLLRGNPSAIFDRILFCHDLAFESCVPAKIEKVYSDHTALARPLIKIVNDAGSVECQPILVTTFWNFHGDFEIHHPLNEGDTGWIIAADRNTDLVKQYNAENDESLNAGSKEPNSDKNLHKYRFGFFFPDRWDKEVIDPKTGRKTKLSVPEELRDCFYIQDRNGWCRIVLDEDGHIAIKAKSSVEIFGDTTIHDDLFCKGDADFALNVSVHGNVTVDGEMLVKNKTRLDDKLTVNADAEIRGNLKVRNTITCDDIKTRDCEIKELNVVTGCKKNYDNEGNVISTSLTISKVKVLRSNILKSDIVEIEGGSSNNEEGGGGVETIIYADDRSIRFFDDTDDGIRKLEIKNWNDNDAQIDDDNKSEFENSVKSFEVVTRKGDARGTLHYVNASLFLRPSFQGAFYWDYKSGYIRNCKVMAGRTIVTAPDFPVVFTGGSTSSTIYAKITHPNSGGINLEISDTSPGGSTMERTVIQIYTVHSDGTTSNDCRGMPCITLYE